MITQNFLQFWIILNILASTITRCISVSASTFLPCIPVGNTSSAIGLKVCAIAAGIKRHWLRTRKRQMIE